MRIVVAPQEYKGTLTAEEAVAAIADGVRQALPDANVEELPLADGGPGTLRAVLTGTGGELRHTTVTGPLGEPVEAEWGLLDDGTAVIEMAAAAGLLLVPRSRRDPRITTTYGLGELIRAALDAGCRRLVIGLGGSATNDGGAGMAQALGALLLDETGEELDRGGTALARLGRIDVTGLDPRLQETEVVGATDVRNPLCGPEGASMVYGPQKGADADAVRRLDSALHRYADVIRRDMDIDVADAPGSGAAGGLGAGLIAFLGATIRPGIEIVAEVLRFSERLAGADLLVTGEGRLDGQTGYGKTVAGAARIAAEAGVPVLVVPGALGPGWEGILPLVAAVEPVVGGGCTAEEAMAAPGSTLAAATERAVRGWLRIRDVGTG
jgi:glycerate kinase